MARTTGAPAEVSRSSSSTGANRAAPGAVPRPRPTASVGAGTGSEPRASAIGSSGTARAEVHALPGEHLTTVGADRRNELGEQTRLAHAGLATDDDRDGVAVDRPRVGGFQLGHLGRATHENRARDAPRHVDSIATLTGERAKIYVARRTPDTPLCRCAARDLGRSVDTSRSSRSEVIMRNIGAAVAAVVLLACACAPASASLENRWVPPRAWSGSASHGPGERTHLPHRTPLRHSRP
jgi:hypothetical protein